MSPRLSERYSVMVRTVAELILAISGILYLAIVCVIGTSLIFTWWVCPIVIILIAILAALFFKVLDHSLTDYQALAVIFIWLPLMLFAFYWLLHNLPDAAFAD